LNTTKNEHAVINFTNVITDLYETQFLTGDKNLVELSTREFNNFDHDTRKWSKNIYNNKQFI
jgi:hypothetical protein